MPPPTRSLRRLHAFTLMEILVVVAIVLVLSAIIFPVMRTVKMRGYRVQATSAMKQLGSATQTYTSQNDGLIPAEDSKGTDTWAAAADPVNAAAWYNSLPKLLGTRTVGDFALDPKGFYTKENLIYLPGATYPDSDKKLLRPLFAIAINTKLQRKDAEGKKSPLKVANIPETARTVLFLEQGLPSEKKSHPTQSKYDGSAKGSARSFVARYGGQGLILFVDGHSEEVSPADLLTESGQFPFPPTDVIWTKNREENPNKGG